MSFTQVSNLWHHGEELHWTIQLKAFVTLYIMDILFIHYFSIVKHTICEKWWKIFTVVKKQKASLDYYERKVLQQIKSCLRITMCSEVLYYTHGILIPPILELFFWRHENIWWWSATSYITPLFWVPGCLYCCFNRLMLSAHIVKDLNSIPNARHGFVVKLANPWLYLWYLSET